MKSFPKIFILIAAFSCATILNANPFIDYEFIQADSCAVDSCVSLEMDDFVEAFMPTRLNSEILTVANCKSVINGNVGKKPKRPKHWVVLSDRSENPFYASPDFYSRQLGEVGFGDTLRIAEIKDGFAKVYIEPYEDISYPFISYAAKMLGWMPVSKLLLWDKSPYQSGLKPQRVIIPIERRDIVIATNPDRRIDDDPFNPSEAFYYVLKTDPVSNNLLISASNGWDRLIGWIPQNKAIWWESRLCIEPNWNYSDVAKFNKPEGKRYSIFSDVYKSSPIAYYQYGNVNPVDNNPITWYRLHADRMRYPLLAKYYDGTYKCWAFHTIDGKINGQDIGYSVKEGYVDKRDASGRPYWNQVIILSGAELDYILQVLDQLKTNSNSDKTFVPALRKVMKTFFPNLSDNDLKQKGLSDITVLLSGIPYCQRNSGLTLGNVEEEAIFNSRKYSQFILDFLYKFDRLKTIRNSDYKYAFINNGTKYYWIPIDEMP